MPSWKDLSSVMSCHVFVCLCLCMCSVFVLFRLVSWIRYATLHTTHYTLHTTRRGLAGWLDDGKHDAILYYTIL